MAKKKRAEGASPRAPIDKRESFLRLGQNRVNKAVHAISQIQHLANPNGYEYTADEAQKIVDALNAAVAQVAERFNNPTSAKVGGFKW